MVEINQILSLSFNRSPNSVSDFKSDRFQCSNLDGHLTTIHILTSKSDFDYMTMSIKCRLRSFFDMFLIKSLLKSIKLTLESIEINLKSNKSM